MSSTHKSHLAYIVQISYSEKKKGKETIANSKHRLMIDVLYNALIHSYELIQSNQKKLPTHIGPEVRRTNDGFNKINMKIVNIQMLKPYQHRCLQSAQL